MSRAGFQTALMAVAGAIACIVSSGGTQAFNVRNDTPFQACVYGSRGHYFDIVGPNSTNRGWNLNKKIKLSVYPYDAFVILENGNTYVKCNLEIENTCNLAPHVQMRIEGMKFEPGDVDGNSGAAAWTMFYVVDAPAKYQLGGCE